MPNTPPNAATLPPADAISQLWWQRSVWWPASAVLLTLGLANGPAAWVLAGNPQGFWGSLAWCGVGSILAQLMLLALLLAGTAETWGRRLTRAYPVALVLFALTASGWYLQAAVSVHPLRPTTWRTNERVIRGDIGGVVLFAAEALLIGVFVAILMCDHYQARFILRVFSADRPLDKTALTNQRVKWSLRDMLLWTTLLAATFGLARFIPWDQTLNPTNGFLGGILCAAIIGWLFGFICLAAIMELYVHSPRSEAVWKHRYNWYLVTLLAALVVFDASDLLSGIESAACRAACTLIAYCCTIALMFATLERFGWQLLVIPQPKKRTGELMRPVPHDLLDP